MKCAKCGKELAGTAVVCHACGHLMPRGDDLELAPAIERPRSPLLSELEQREENADDDEPQAPLDREAPGITFENERRFNDYWLPGIVLLVSLALYVGFSIRHFGIARSAIVGQDLGVLLLLELPLAVLGMQIAVIAFGFDFGMLGSSTLKLFAFAMLGWSVFAVAATITAATFKPIPEIEAGEPPQTNFIDGTPTISDRKANERLLNIPYSGLLIATVGLLFQLAFLRVMFGGSMFELLTIAGVNWLIAVGLYFGFRFLFDLPGWFETA